MDVNSSGGASDWLYDYGFDIPVAGSDFMASDSGGFRWGPQSHNFKGPSNMRWVCFLTFYSSFNFLFGLHFAPQKLIIVFLIVP